MTDETDFIEYMQIQGTTELITKTELLAEVRSRGLQISERTLTFYATKGIIPKAARIGTRTGVYPRIVVELLSLALLNRQRNASIDATLQLIPLWKLIARGAISGDLDLAEIEYVARQHVTLPDANFVFPFMMKEILSYLSPRDSDAILWRLKNGESVRQTRSDSFEVTFLLGATDELGVARVIAWTQLKLPGFDDEFVVDDPQTIILGVPVGVSIQPQPGTAIQGASNTASAAPDRQEVDA
ncbi:MAG: hypothetical protein IT195_11790 [Microthrixaceae bacterium]|nr:hypothetical protein [Microthrixaceae bacterium]